jgi:hypothetical protein
MRERSAHLVLCVEVEAARAALREVDDDSR